MYDYRFRRVICPRCGHGFRHMEQGLCQGAGQTVYLLKETGEMLDRAVCPLCAFGMALLKDQPLGIDPEEERIITSRGRGCEAARDLTKHRPWRIVKRSTFSGGCV